MDAMDRDGITYGGPGRGPGRLFERCGTTVGGLPDGRRGAVGLIARPWHSVSRRLPLGEKPHEPRADSVGQPRDLDRSRLEPRPLDHVEHEPLDSVG